VTDVASRPVVGSKNVTAGPGADTPRPAPDPEFWRRSKVEAFLQCTTYENDESNAAQLGTAFHHAAKLYWRLCLDQGVQSDWDSVNRIAAQAFAATGGLHPDQLDELVDLLEHFAHTRLVEPDAVVALEEPLVVPSGLTNPRTKAPIFWRGQPDILLRELGGDPDEDPVHLVLRDYKTHRALVYNLFQGRFYAMLVFLAYPYVELVTVQFDYVRSYVQGRERDEPVELHYERGELDPWWALVGDMLLQRLAMPPEPTGCLACEYCRRRHDCGKAIEPFRSLPENMDEAIAMARQKLRAGQVTRSANARLKAFMTNRPKVEIDLGAGQVMEMGNMKPVKPTLRTRDPLELVTHLTALGLRGADFLVTWADVKKIPKALVPGLLEAGVLYEDGGQESFKLRKAPASKQNASELKLAEVAGKVEPGDADAATEGEDTDGEGGD